MNAVENLRALRALLANPETLVHGLGTAFNAKGNHVQPTSRNAVRFTLVGAICRVAGFRNDDDPTWQAIVAVTGRWVSDWSRTRSHGEHIAMIDEAIVRVQS